MFNTQFILLINGQKPIRTRSQVAVEECPSFTCTLALDLNINSSFGHWLVVEIWKWIIINFYGHKSLFFFFSIISGPKAMPIETVHNIQTLISSRGYSGQLCTSWHMLINGRQPIIHRISSTTKLKWFNFNMSIWGGALSSRSRGCRFLGSLTNT